MAMLMIIIHDIMMIVLGDLLIHSNSESCSCSSIYHPPMVWIPVDEVVLLEGVQHNRDPSTEETRQSRIRKPTYEDYDDGIYFMF